ACDAGARWDLRGHRDHRRAAFRARRHRHARGRARRVLACGPMLMLVAVPVDSVLTPLQAFILGAVQGITELLPISSSAHLYLVPTLLGWRYEGVAFDVALHAGTL